MTLSDLIDVVTTKVNQTESEDRDAAKMFLQRRRDMIWGNQFWKDALFEYTQVLTSSGYAAATSTWLPTRKILLLPTLIEHVAAVRTETRRLTIESSERLYRMDYDTFAGTGTAIQYRDLPPAVWQFDTAQTVACDLNGSSEHFDLVVDTLGSDEITITRTTFSMPDPAALIQNVLRVDSIGKPVIDAGTTDINIGGTNFVSLAHDDTAAPKRCRIQLFGTVPSPSTIRVLGILKAPKFTSDNDEPGLTDIENCLLAFAQADMLERERQYGRAQALKQEGMLLLEQLKNTQTWQAAYSKRIMPDGGYGWDYATNVGPLTW